VGNSNRNKVRIEISVTHSKTNDRHRFQSQLFPRVPRAITLEETTPPKLNGEESGRRLAWIIHDFAGGKRKGALKD
jgi:hypothetical protein